MAGSILETFYILFKTDAKDLDDGAKKAQETTDKLEKSISGADKASVELGKKFNNLASAAVASFASVFAVTQLISDAKGIASHTKELHVLAEILGVSATQIINWGRAVEASGGDASTFEGTLRGINAGMIDAMRGGNATTKAFSLLKTSVRDSNMEMRTVIDMLPDIAKGFEGLNREGRQLVSQTLGVDEGLILFLGKGERKVLAMVAAQAALNRVTEDQHHAIEHLRRAWRTYENKLKDTKTIILAKLAPALEVVLHGLSALGRWIAENEDVVSAFFITLGIIIGTLVVKALLLALPFVLTAAAIGLVVFAVQAMAKDMFAFFTGEDSFIGDAIARWEFLADGVELVGEKFADLMKWIEKVKKGFSTIKVPAVFESIGKSVLGALDDLDERYKRFKEDAVLEGKQALSLVSNTPLQALGASNAAAGAVNSSSRSTTVTVGEVNIETQATDAEGIGSAIADELGNQLQNAIDDTDDGIAG